MISNDTNLAYFGESRKSIARKILAEKGIY